MEFIRLIYRRRFVSSMLALLGNALGQIVNAIIIGRALGAEELSVNNMTVIIE